MKIMTFNTQHCLNYIEQKIDFDIMADAIKKCNPDIVGLNEMRDKGTNADFDAQTKILSDLTGLKNHYFAKAIDVGTNNPYGNAILSKIPFASVQTIPVPDPEVKKFNGGYESRCLLKAKLENGITVLVIHFGLNPDEQANAVKTVLENSEDEKCIIMGDFNIEPDSSLLIPIKERFYDAADLINSPAHTFPSDKPKIKIDYIFVSRDIKVVSADIPEIIASDHRPHTAILTDF